LGQFTGLNLAGQARISTTNSITVILLSDESIALQGFVLSYQTGNNYILSAVDL